MSANQIRFGGASRLARAIVVGGACLFITSFLHGAAGGCLDAGSVVLAGVLSVALAGVIVDQRRTTTTIVAALLTGQVLLHLVLSVGAGHAGAGPTSMSGAAMVLAHVVACLISGVVLARADEVVHLWIEFVRSLCHPLPAVWQPLPWVFPLAGQATVVKARRTAVGVIASRGPPVS